MNSLPGTPKALDSPAGFFCGISIKSSMQCEMYVSTVHLLSIPHHRARASVKVWHTSIKTKKNKKGPPLMESLVWTEQLVYSLKFSVFWAPIRECGASYSRRDPIQCKRPRLDEKGP